jgi:hypothetical protein
VYPYKFQGEPDSKGGVFIIKVRVWAVGLITMAGGKKPASGDVALLLQLLVCITLLQSGSAEGLTVGFYNNICPGAEAAITNAVKSKFNADKTVVPGILRMYFHDCFVRVSNHLIYTYRHEMCALTTSMSLLFKLRCCD